MVVIIGNQKGGAGKSTLAMLLANYLSIVKKEKVTVLDLDYQQSLSQKFESAKILDSPPPYEVVGVPLENYPTVLEIVRRNPRELIIIDLPGKLDDKALLPALKSAEVAICPFSYDEFSFQPTMFFALVMKKLNPDVRMVFVPNRIKGNVRYITQQEIHEQLGRYGEVTAWIADRIDFTRASTYYTPLSLLPVIQPVFEAIYQDYIQTAST